MTPGLRFGIHTGRCVRLRVTAGLSIALDCFARGAAVEMTGFLEHMALVPALCDWRYSASRGELNASGCRASARHFSNRAESTEGIYHLPLRKPKSDEAD